MDQLKFRYYLLYEAGDRDTNPIQPDEAPLNLIARAFSTGRIKAVAWFYRTQEWTFQPRVAMAILHVNSDRHRTRMVDRETAEREALRFATKPLPSEAELTAICQAALED